ncbi:MAG: hypothetical protein HFJ57_00205 [Clostridia bacterium]|nr:hypothetical protein [Clostridia bacterium]
MKMKPFKPIELHTYNSDSEKNQLILTGTVSLNPYDISSVETHDLNKGENWEKFFPESERCKISVVGDAASIVTMKTGKKYSIAEPLSYISKTWEDSMK